MKTKPKKITVEEAWGFEYLMVTAAVRYSLGRMTYVVSACCDWVILNWERFPRNIREIIERDVEEAFSEDDAARKSGKRNLGFFPLGWDCDRKEWERVRKLWLES